MAGTLSLSSAVQVFPCPNCRETINTSALACPFCNAPIDPIAAEQAAAATSKISQACSDASYFKVMAWMLLTFFLVGLIPFLSHIGFAGVWFLRVAIPVMTIRWWVKFGAIKTTDPDFSRARRTAIIASIVGFLALASAL